MVDYLSPAGLKRKIDDLLARTEQALGRLDGGRAQLNGGGSKHQKTAPAQKAGRPATPQVHGSSNVLEDVKRLVKKVASNRNSVIFCKVVDPVTDQVPDYLDVVCRPLDFGTIVKRIDADARAPPGTHHYPDVPTLYADFHQVCANATTYWAKQPDSFIYSTAEKLLKRCATCSP
ncbi:Transcription factor GTE10 [Diplonema papillatum]|nr:Transcription factor GTE10 [Diplonema papillatum]KAJ9452065.1 Transcription factor GTE10 [Diplonema papillatum]